MNSLLIVGLWLAALSQTAVHGWVTPPSSSFARSKIPGGGASSTTTTTTTSLYGVSSTFRRARDSLLNRERSREDLKIGIAGFYDRSSKLWEEVWGEHMHHGYYVPEDRTDHVQAQIDLIDEVLKWAEVPDEQGGAVKSAVDVGCGIGGSSRHIARKYNCKAQGITLSPYQANRGNELAAEQGLSDQTNFQVRLWRRKQKKV